MEEKQEVPKEESFAEYDEQRIEKQVQARSTLPMLLLVCLFGAVTAEGFLFGGPYGIAVPVGVLLLCGVSLWYLSLGKQAFRVRGCWWLLPLFVLGLFPLSNSSKATNWLTLLVLCGLFAVFLLDTSGAVDSRFYELRFPVAGARLLCPYTLNSLAAPFRAIRTRMVRNGGKRTGRYVFLGLLAAIPFFFILLLLFVRADALFGKGVETILQRIDGRLVGHGVLDAIAGVGLGIYLGTALMVLRTARSLRPELKEHRGWLPGAAVNAFLSVLVLLEGLFCVVQFRYLFGGAQLPEGVTYASYARSGFFALAAACILTVGIIAVVSLVTRQGKTGLPGMVRGLLTLFSACVGVLYASAFYRMGLYIRVYGLTVKRVLVCWLMALLGLMLCGIVGKIWNRRVKLTGFLLLAILLMTVVLNALHVDALVAGVNVERYLKNQTAIELDVNYLGSLSADVVPYLEKLIGTPKQNDALEAMADIQHRLQETTLRTWSPKREKAKAVLAKYELQYDPLGVQTRKTWPHADVLLTVGDGTFALIQKKTGDTLFVNRRDGTEIVPKVNRWLMQDSFVYIQSRDIHEDYHYMKVDLERGSYKILDSNNPADMEELERIAALFGERAVPSVPQPERYD